MTKRFLAVLLAVLLVGAMIPLTASAAEIASGESEDGNVSWTLDSNGTLTVSGSGDIHDVMWYAGNIEEANWMSNWAEYASQVKSIVIDGDFEMIPCRAFESMPEPQYPALLNENGEPIIDETTWMPVPDTTQDPLLPGGPEYVYSQLTSVTMSDSITYIDWNAFAGSPSLKTVKLSSNLEIIDNNVFVGCTALTSIDLPASLQNIGASAFSLTGLTSIDLPEGVKIGPVAFGNTKLTSVVIPEGVIFDIPPEDDYFYYGAFEGCEQLTSVVFEGAMEMIPSFTFSGCTSLKEVKLPSGLKKIAVYAFVNTNLETLELPEGLEYIYEGAFIADLGSSASGVKSLNIPASVKYVGPWSFCRWDNLETLTFAEDSTAEIDKGAFVGCDSLKTVTIPEGVTLTGDPFGFDETTQTEGEDGYRIPYEGFTILGYVDSAAEAYANQYGFTFVNLSRPGLKADVQDKLDEGFTLESDRLPADKAEKIVNTAISAEFEGFANDMQIVVFDLKLTDGNGDEIHNKEVTVLLAYPDKDVADNWEKYTFVALHLLEDGTVEMVEVTATPYGLVYTGTCSGFGIAYGEKPITFTDVKESDWFYTPVQWAVANNVTAGTSDTTFSPTLSCTRAQAVTFLWNAQGQPEPQGTNNPFTDVKEDAWYYKAVLWAVENNITAGTSATTFSPTSTCTRGQIVTFLHNYAKKPAAEGTNPFTDVKTGDWYYQPVLWAVSNGVTAGMTPTTFGPTSTCTRGQIVTFLYNYLGKE